MDEKLVSITVNDLVAATTYGVLRALDARMEGVEKAPTLDLVQSGFYVDIHIIAGGIRPDLLNRPGIPGVPGLPGANIG
jgi:hypothetical protein